MKYISSDQIHLLHLTLGEDVLQSHKSSPTGRPTSFGAFAKQLPKQMTRRESTEVMLQFPELKGSVRMLMRSTTAHEFPNPMPFDVQSGRNGEEQAIEVK